MDAAIVHLVDFKRITYMESCFNDLHYLQTKSVVLGCHLNQPYPIQVLSVSHFLLLSVSSCHSYPAYTCWMQVLTLHRLQTTGQTLCRLCSHVHTRTHAVSLSLSLSLSTDLMHELQPFGEAGQLMSAHMCMASWSQWKASKSLGPFKEHVELAVVNAKDWKLLVTILMQRQQLLHCGTQLQYGSVSPYFM